MYGLDATGRELVDAAHQLAQETALPAAADVDERGRFPEEAVDALRKQGFFGLGVPAEFGGKEQPPRVFAAVTEELAQGCPSTAMIYVMHVAAARAIVDSATLGQRDEILREIAAGKHLTTLAFSERGSRSQFWAPVSKLEPLGNGDGYVTTAEKSFVTSASYADSYVSSAQAPEADSPLESTLYLLRTGGESVRIAGGFNGLGLRGNDSSPVSVENARIPRDSLLSEPGGGADMMLQSVLPWFIVGTSAMANGLCRAALQSTTGHLTKTGFDHDGKKLRDLPNLRSRVAQMSVRTEQSRALLSAAAGMMEAPDEQTPLYLLQARTAALDAALNVTDLAMKACGGAAFSKHLGVERLFRDARAGWVMAPTVDHLHEFVGRALTGLPLFEGPPDS